MADSTGTADKVYRPTSRRGPVGGGLVTVAVVAGLTYAVGNGVPAPVTGGLLAVVAVLFALGCVRSRRSATVASPNGLVVRRVVGTRVVEWPDVQAVEAEAQPVWTARAREMRQAAVVYDRRGGRIALPHVDDAEVPSLADEIQALRALWEHRRGTDWRQAPGITAAMDHARHGKQRQGAWLLGSLLAAGALFCALVVVVVVLTDGPVTALVLIGVMPVAAAVAAFIYALNKQKGREQAELPSPVPDSAPDSAPGPVPGPVPDSAPGSGTHSDPGPEPKSPDAGA